ncbi:hypothetical protein Q3Y64_12155 [Uliginosibacterium sp. 31-12]|nr:hypothetical protein [Uliginosibacterium sp. 31-12]
MEEIAFIVSGGMGKWFAVNQLNSLKSGRYCLWHVSSGPLPLFRGASESPGQIANPFEGWLEVKAGADSSQPYFGAGHPGVFWLNVRGTEIHHLSGLASIGLSSFEWVGNHYKSIGSSATPETEKLWKSLGRWVKKSTVKVPRGGPNQGTSPEIWAFPNAEARFENGAIGGNV